MWKVIKNIDEYSSIFMIVLMCTCITVQVFFRYFLDNSLDWAEELARYSFICSVFLGSSFAASEGRHLEINAIKFLAGKRIKFIINVFSTLVTLIFCLFLFIWGIKLVLFVKEIGQISTSLDFDMYILYAVVPISMFMMAIRTIVFFIKNIHTSEEIDYSQQ